jgi:hypothetical protein
METINKEKNDKEISTHILIDPCYFENKGKYEDLASFYGKVCTAGEPQRKRAKPYLFKHLEEDCYIGSTSGGDGNYAGCCVDSGQLCLVPESIADKLVIQEHIEPHMYRKVYFKKPASKLELMKILELALRNIYY